MNSIVNINAFGFMADAADAPMPASRGILALQGISTSCFDASTALVNPPVYPSVVVKHVFSGGWQHVALGVSAMEANEPAAALQAVRLRDAHPATVIRNRQRCRPR
ncbi:hypothetical protein [Nocardia callitridis]|uniref:Uncharacterized protein n=1 Tax=Nocardia callitridis TaxID=648753 RepID=A0ABP9JTS6_9NOCA